MAGKTFLTAGIVCVVGLASLLGATEPPPIPPGYENEPAVMAALATRQVKLIDAKNLLVPVGVEEKLGVEYGQGGGRPLQLDLYVPKERTKAGPAILFIHGGA